MQFCRMYTGDDGKSHFEELDQSEGAKLFQSASRSKHWSSRTIRTATICTAGTTRRGVNGASRCLAPVEIGIGDGTKKTFGPGDVFLAEDVTGQGHTALPKNWVRAFIHL